MGGTRERERGKANKQDINSFSKHTTQKERKNQGRKKEKRERSMEVATYSLFQTHPHKREKRKKG